MKIIRETIVAGGTILTRLKAGTRIKTEKGKKRAAKTNPTPEAVQRVNTRNAIWNLTAVLNHNFRGGDYLLTLTYEGEEPSKERAKADRRNFLRNIKNYCDRRGTGWKWVAVTEFENKRIHHHIVCSGIDPELIKDKWKHGFVNFKYLDRSGEYSALAEYLVKETNKTFRMPDAVNKKRYSSSGSIIIPDTKREEVSERVISGELKPAKGYYIAKDTVRKYDHAILGMECVEYIQISLEDNPRLKRWNKGKKVKREKRYKENWTQQIAFDDYPEF